MPVERPVMHVKYLMDREQDYALTLRTRKLLMPDGNYLDVETFEIFWMWFDRLDKYTDYKHSRVIEMTHRSQKDTGRDFFLELEIMIYFLVKTFESYDFSFNKSRAERPQPEVVKEIMEELLKKSKDGEF